MLVLVVRSETQGGLKVFVEMLALGAARNLQQTSGRLDAFARRVSPVEKG